MGVVRRTYETNVFGVVAVTNAFLPALRRSAHPRIVNVSSGTGSLTWSTRPNPQFDYQAAGKGSGAAYRSSKTALDALTVFYAHALAEDGFKVNALAPGLRATNLNPQAAAAGGDPAEAAAGAVRLALLGDDGPTGQLSPGTGRSCRGDRRSDLLTPSHRCGIGYTTRLRIPDCRRAKHIRHPRANRAAADEPRHDDRAGAGATVGA